MFIYVNLTEVIYRLLERAMLCIDFMLSMFNQLLLTNRAMLTSTVSLFVDRVVATLRAQFAAKSEQKHLFFVV